jgi:hypothetical protein
MTKAMILQIELCGTKMTIISVRFHFVSHLVINHIKTDNCLLLHTNFFAIFSATLFEEIAAETNRYISEEINEAMPLKEHSVLVGWKDVTTRELTTFHGVIFNMARHVKCFIKGLFL